MGFKNEEYILIQGWMINELNLKGNDLLIYAIIYRYSQDGIHKFYGSLQYLADWANSTIPGIQNNLKNLLERDLIFKNKLGDTSSSKCEYWVNLSIQQSYNSIQQSCNNNILKNNLFISKDINNLKSEPLDKVTYFENNKKSRSYKVLQTWLTLYIDDIDIRDSLRNWLTTMYNNKKIANLECLKSKVDFLDETLKSKEDKITVIKDATDRLWFTFQYSVDILKKNKYNNKCNIQGSIPTVRDDSTLDLADEVF